ncbi:MAG: Dabb family protein [Bacteroidota bacterium]|nr:Dabb family protein [Bacteroidota bacterium]
MEGINRKKFFEKLSKIIFIAGLATLPTSATMAQKKKDEEVFVHHVYFWMNNGKTEKDKEKLLEGLKTLKNIVVIKQVYIGKPASTKRDVIDTSYDFSLLLMFKNHEDQEVYQTHPIHLEFIKNYAHLWSKVIVYDSVNA